MSCAVCLQQNRTCNEWALLAPHEEPLTLCRLLEQQFGCDCTGCECMRPLPLPPPPPASITPPPGWETPPGPMAPPPAAPEDLTAQTVAMVVLVLVITGCCSALCLVTGCLLGWFDQGAPLALRLCPTALVLPAQTCTIARSARDYPRGAMAAAGPLRKRPVTQLKALGKWAGGRARGAVKSLSRDSDESEGEGDEGGLRPATPELGGAKPVVVLNAAPQASAGAAGASDAQRGSRV